jgi:beta-lactamase regulating signal transducer with metallopeptidase domain
MPLPESRAFPDTVAARRHQGVHEAARPGPAAFPWNTGSGTTGKILVVLWLAGAVVLLGLHLARFAQVRRFVRARSPVSPALAAVLADEAARCGLSGPPVLLVSPRFPSPAVFGGIRGTLLLPAWLASPARSPRLRWILRHELAHLRHRDHWALLIQTVAGILFWFHPFVWWARRNWHRNMERACDDAVAADPADARQYAATLVAVIERLLAEPRFLRGTPALFATRTEAGYRVKRLVDRARRVPRPLGATGLAVWIATAIAAGALGLRPPIARAADHQPARASVKIDFGPDDQRVEAGWIRWSGDRNQDFSTAFDRDFEVEVDRNHSWRERGDDDDRDGDKDADRASTGALGFVLRDGIRERNDRDVRFTFRRLDPGDYVLEFFSCDMGEKKRAAVGHFDVRIDGKLVLENQATMGRVSLASAALPPLTLTSHGKPVVVKLVRRDGDLWVNGLILSGPVRLPEE